MNLPPLTIAVAGLSGAGKTSLLERLVPRLSGQGVRVGYLKANAHRIDLDREGKDTERLNRAGASVTGILGRQGSAFFPGRLPGMPDHAGDSFHDPPAFTDRDDGFPSNSRAVAPADGEGDLRTRVLLWNLRAYFRGCDLLLVEGMKASPVPKILINRGDNPRGVLAPDSLRNVVLHLQWPSLPSDWTKPLLEGLEMMNSLLQAASRTHARGVVGGVLARGATRHANADRSLETAYLPLAERCEETWVIGRIVRPGDADLPGLLHPVMSHLELRALPGPLAGLETALTVAGDRAVLAVPCDRPCVPETALDRLLEARGSGASAVACGDGDGISEPAAVLLEARSLEPLGRYLDQGGGTVAEFLRSVQTRWLPPPMQPARESF